MKLVLVRHGQTAWSVSGRHTSTTDLALTEPGRAAASGSASGSPAASSRSCSPRPALRALETARLAGFEPEIDPDLAEVDYGDYEGLTTPEIRAQRPDWTLWGDGSPGGETLEAAGARADRVIARALAAGGDAAVFAHGHILRVLGARWIGLPAERGGSFALDTAAISELGFERETRVIGAWNLT